MTPGDLDDDFGDTVLRPSMAPEPTVAVEPDLDDTLPVGSVPRPVTAPVALVPPKIATAAIDVVPVEPQEQLEMEPVEPVAPAPVAPVQPVMLVEPPAPPPRSSAPPVAGSDIPDVSDNIWSEPLPKKPLPFRLLLDDGTIVPLDQTVYLGRKPRVPRIHPGGIPLLVTMDSPQREVSSTHLELTTVGGAIVATDLKSTNGSVLRPPGGEPRTLVAGASAVVTPGTVIELGDGNTIELMAPDYQGDDDADGALP